MNRALLDTSVFIAQEQRRSLERPLPDEVAVSVVTMAEMEVGVHMATNEGVRATRLQTLLAARERVAGIGIDQHVASAYARLAASALRAGRRPRVHDTWIAATALVHGAAVWTQDADFVEFEEIDVVRV